MPELPEVETTKRGIAPHISGHILKQLTIRQPKLRWPVTRGLKQRIEGTRLLEINRRGKYLILQFESGCVLMHLGMSGSMRIVDENTPAEKHDHVDLVFDNGRCLRFHDPRRFGAMLWAGKDPYQHKLLKELGPEPLSSDFNAQQLFENSRKKVVPIKSFLMNSRHVVGVGNIYASESLFMAGIHPNRPAGRISLARYEKLVAAVKEVLGNAISQGGTTLRDFVGGDGKPGYFAQQLAVYGKAGQPCEQCGTAIKLVVIGQRSSYYCTKCQR